jgi:hypothetical protein
MPVVVACLQERASPELVSVALDTLCCVIGEADDIKDMPDSGEHDELGERFAEIFMKNADQVSKCMCVCTHTHAGATRVDIVGRVRVYHKAAVHSLCHRPYTALSETNARHPTHRSRRHTARYGLNGRNARSSP